MTTASFRHHERMCDPADFRRAFERRKTASDDVLIVYAVENGREFARLGISVGKKKVKTAVARNRIKRRLREAFRLSKSDLPTGVDYVVVPRGPAIDFARAMTTFPHLARSAARRIDRRLATPP